MRIDADSLLGRLAEQAPQTRMSEQAKEPLHSSAAQRCGVALV
jgi:hypothetical protein